MKLPKLTTLCPSSGQVFQQQLVGAFVGEPDEVLEERREHVVALLGAFGFMDGPAGVFKHEDKHFALAVEVEALEAMLNFELEPPCGCESHEGVS